MRVKIKPDFTVSAVSKSCKEVLGNGVIYVFTNDDEDVLCVALNHSQPGETSLAVIISPLGAAIDTCQITVSGEDYQEAEKHLNAWLDAFYLEDE